MSGLISNFFGYIRISIGKCIPIFFIGLACYFVFLLLVRNKYTRRYRNPWRILRGGAVLSFATAAVYVMTIYGRVPGEDREWQLVPFSSLVEAITTDNSELLLSFLMNIVIFIPIGFCLPYCFRAFGKHWVTFGYMALIILLIELCQGVAGIGMFEVDDVINNLVGTEIGYWFWRIRRKKRRYFSFI